jgi:hypothetical protein
MTLIEEYNFRIESNDFWKRVEEAGLRAANSIRAESPGSDTRRTWAFAVIEDPVLWAGQNRIPVVLHWMFIRDGSAIADADLISLAGSLAPA